VSAAPGEDKPQATRKVVASPDGKISLTFDLADGVPTYAVSFQNKPVILRSALGFELKEGALKSGFEIGGNGRICQG